MIVLVIIVCAENGHYFIGIIIVILILVVKIIQVFLFDGIRLFCEILGP